MGKGITFQKKLIAKYGSNFPAKILPVTFGARGNDYESLRQWGTKSKLNKDKQRFIGELNGYLGNKDLKNLSANQVKVLQGSCPHAQMMGFEHMPVRFDRSQLAICSHLKATCCSNDSMYKFKSNWMIQSKKLSALMWTISKFPTMMNTLLSNMNLQMRHCTKELGETNDKLKEKEKNMEKLRADAIKEKAKGAKKDDDKKDDKKPAAGAKDKKTPEKSKANQAKAKEAAAAQAAMDKAAAKTAKDKATADKAEKAKADKAKPKGPTRNRLLWVFKKIMVKKPGEEWKSIPGKWNAKHPRCRAKFIKAWNTANELALSRGDLFRKTTKCLHNIARLKNEVACAACTPVQADGLGNFMSGMGMRPNDTNLVQHYCGIMFNEMHRHQTALKEFYYYMSVVFERRAISNAFKRLVEWQTPDVAACIPENVDEYAVKRAIKDVVDSTTKANKPSQPKTQPQPKKRRLQAPATPATKPATPATKPATPATKPVTPATKPVTPATKPVTPAAKPDNDDFADDLLPQGSGLNRDPFKSNQSVVIDSWTAWQYSLNANKLTTTIIPGKKCWNTPAMRALVKEIIYYGGVTSLKRLIAPLMGAMRLAFKYAGNADAWNSWIDFRGQDYAFRAIFPNRGSWFSSFSPKTFGRPTEETTPAAGGAPTTPAAAAVTPKKRQLRYSKRSMQAAESNKGPLEPAYEQKINLKETGLEIPSDIGVTGGLDHTPSLNPLGQINPASGHLYVVSYVGVIL